jgi:hypothetical protein
LTLTHFLAALYSSILTNEVTKNLAEDIPPAAIGAGLPVSSLPALFAGLSNGSFANAVGITPSIIETVVEVATTSYAHAFRIVFLVTVPFEVCLVAAAVLSPNVERFMTGEVTRRLGRNPGNLATKEDFESE